MQKTNLKQLANKLHVSISTVSKALRDSYEIGSDTKKKVLEMAEKMGYRANPYAKSVTKRPDTVRIILSC